MKLILGDAEREPGKPVQQQRGQVAHQRPQVDQEHGQLVGLGVRLRHDGRESRSPGILGTLPSPGVKILPIIAAVHKKLDCFEVKSKRSSCLERLQSKICLVMLILDEHDDDLFHRHALVQRDATGRDLRDLEDGSLRIGIHPRRSGLNFNFLFCCNYT